MDVGISLIFNAHRDTEEGQAYQEEEGDGANTEVDITGDLADDTDQGGAHKGRTFAADVHDAKVFAGLLGWNDTCKVGAGKSLNAPLKHPYQHGENPKLQLAFEKNGKDGNAKVCKDAEGD